MGFPVDEASRRARHRLVVFRDGPTGRRACLAGGPDVWEVVRAVQSTQRAEPRLTGDRLHDLVAETCGVPVAMIQAALAYWAEFPEEIEARIAAAELAEEQARSERERAGHVLD